MVDGSRRRRRSKRANSAAFEALSVEAKVLVGGWCGVRGATMITQIAFRWPETIHPRTRKGLDDLVAAGYLTVKSTENGSVAWTPTALLVSERPRVPAAFLKSNHFPTTIE